MGVCECKAQSPFLLHADCLIPEENKSTLSKRSSQNKTTVQHNPNHRRTSLNNHHINADSAQPTCKSKKTASKSSCPHINEIQTNNNNNNCVHVASIDDDTAVNRIEVNEGDKIMKCLNEHFLFNISEIESTSLDEGVSVVNDKSITEFKYKKYVQKEMLFKEGDTCKLFYMLITGKCEIYSSETHTVIHPKQFSCFGDIALLNTKAFRTYSAKALSPCTFLVLSHKAYRTIHNNNFSPPNTPYIYPNNTIINILKRIRLFNCISESDLLNISAFGCVKTYDQGETTPNIVNYIVIVNDGHLIGMNGEIELTMENDGVSYMMNHVLFPQQKRVLRLKALKRTEVVLIHKNMLIECFGLNFQRKLLFPYFVSYLQESAFFSNIFNKSEYIELFNLLKLVTYPSNTEIFNINNNKQRKLFLLIDGSISSSTQHNLLCEQLLTLSIQLNTSLYVKTNTTLLECDWDEVLLNESVFQAKVLRYAKHLRLNDLMRNMSESAMRDIALNVSKCEYSRNDVVVKSNEGECKLGIVDEGEVQLVCSGKCVKTYTQRCVFGEHLLLHNNNHNDECFVVASEKASVFMLSGWYVEYLYNTDETFKYNITLKVNKENRNVRMDELYYVNEVQCGCGIIVHNGICSFIIECIPKTKSNYTKVCNELRYYTTLSHELIVSFIKAFETNNYMLYLFPNYNNNLTLEQFVYEYCCGVDSSSTPLASNTKRKWVFFYASCLFAVIHYLHSKHIMHRNITTMNVLIDEDGYMRLKNFALSKSVNCNKTSTVCGVPKFTAPEILNGEDYSFAVDYWSVGICLYFIYYAKYPFDGDDSGNPWSVYNEIVCKKLSFKNCDKAVRVLLEKLLCKDKRSRVCSLKQIKELSCAEMVDIKGVGDKTVEVPVVPRKGKGVDFAMKQMKCSEYVDKCMGGCKGVDNRVEWRKLI